MGVSSRARNARHGGSPIAPRVGVAIRAQGSVVAQSNHCLMSGQQCRCEVPTPLSFKYIPTRSLLVGFSMKLFVGEITQD